MTHHSLRMFLGALRFLLAIVLAAAGLAMVHGVGAQINPANLIVSINEFTGSSDAPRNIAEYTASGSRVQILSRVPAPGGTLPSTDRARDLVLGADNAIYLYNGTFDPYLARFDLQTRTWSQTTFSGWSTANNSSYGGLGGLNHYTFVTDMNTGGAGAPQGVVRFDTSNGSAVRFAESINPNDLYIGPDGVLYALDGSASTVFKFNPVTFAALGSVTLPVSDCRGVAAAADGSILVADWNGVITRCSAGGTLLDSLSVSGARFSDIDINPDGRIALGTGSSGEVVLTDLSLDSFTRFRVTDSAFGGDTFVSWATPVPEPSTLAILLLCAVGLSCCFLRKKG